SLGRGEVVLGGAALLATIACAVLALARPAFDADVPRPMNLVYVGTDSTARLLLQPRADLPAGFLRDNGFVLESERVLPWSGRGFAGPDGPALTPPVLELEQDVVIDGKRQLRIHLRSAR